jgi:hypothetical protein
MKYLFHSIPFRSIPFYSIPLRSVLFRQSKQSLSKLKYTVHENYITTTKDNETQLQKSKMQEPHNE